MIMKKNILFLAMSAALLTSSCSDFLDVQPEGNATINAYFLNDQQAIDAVDGLYERFHQEALYGRELFWEQGAACDVVWGRTRSYTDLALFTNDASSSTPLNGIFETLYKVIARSNWVIKGLLNKEKKVALTPVETRSLGEAYFTRGWAHFWWPIVMDCPNRECLLSAMKILKETMIIPFLPNRNPCRTTIE